MQTLQETNAMRWSGRYGVPSMGRFREMADGGAMAGEIGPGMERPDEKANRERDEARRQSREDAVDGGADAVARTAGVQVDEVAKLLMQYVLEDTDRDAKSTARDAERIENWKRAAHDAIAELTGGKTEAEVEAGKRDEERGRKREESRRREIFGEEPPIAESYAAVRREGRGWDPDRLETTVGDGGPEYDQLLREGGRGW